MVTEAEATGFPNSIAMALWAKANAISAVDPVAAVAAYERAAIILRACGNRFWEILIVLELAALQARRGDPDTALRDFQRMLESWGRSTDIMFVSHGIGSLIVLFERIGCRKGAAMLHGALASTLEANPFVPELMESITRVRSDLGDVRFAEATERGSRVPLHEVHVFAAGLVARALAGRRTNL